MSTRIVTVEDPPRSVSVMDMRNNNPFLTRTSMFFKKVSYLKNVRRKSDERKSAGGFPRNARSVELGNKAFGMSQPILGVNTDHCMTDAEDLSDPSSTVSDSPTNTNMSKPSEDTKAHTSKTPAANADTASRADAPHGLPPLSPQQPSTKPVVEGLPPVGDGHLFSNELNGSTDTAPSKQSSSATSSITIAPVTDVGIVESDSHGSDQTFHSATEHIAVSSSVEATFSNTPSFTDRALTSSPPPLDETSPSPSSPSVSRKVNPSTPRNPFITLDTTSAQSRAQSLPSRNLLSPNATPSLSSTPLIVPTSPVDSEATVTPRAIHPRLASLPPPMMARYATQGSARLTPSLGPRQPPMPILNLPTLPLPTPRTPPPTAAQTQSPARLRGVPALPLRGPSEFAQADHDNAGLDDMEEMDEDDGEGDDELPAAHLSDEDDDSPQHEVPMMGRRLRSPLPPSLSRSPRLPALPPVDTSSFSVPFRLLTPTGTVTARPDTVYLTPSEPIPTDILRTPIQSIRKSPAFAAAITDYFTSQQPESTDDATSTPRPRDVMDGLVVPRTVPMPSTSPRPGLYHQGSKSMIDLLSITRKGKEKEPTEVEKRISRAPDYAMATTRDTPENEADVSAAAVRTADVPMTPPLRRQRSLPMYNTATEPPPYPSFLPQRPHAPLLYIQPREEEGREQLPKYANTIYLSAIMPRKLEFTAPGQQAKDRKWKRALCVLEGTIFKVYRVHGGVVEDWWERAVGVGDRTSVDPSAMGASGTIRVSAVREPERGERERKGEASPWPDVTAANAQGSSSTAGPSSHPPTSRSKLHLAASLLHPSRSHASKLGTSSNSNSRSRLSLDTRQEGNRNSASSTPHRQSLDSSRPTRSTSASSSRLTSSNPPSDSSTTPTSLSTSPTSSSLSGRSTSATSHFSGSSSGCTVSQEPDNKDLNRAYTLQNAESGLASDYTKRKNVIRVRMEGEQFLLQAKDVPAVIEWIEGIQAATNIALDLDDRPMPKGPIFPRRRRRRARRPEGQGQDNTAASSSRPTR